MATALTTALGILCVALTSSIQRYYASKIALQSASYQSPHFQMREPKHTSSTSIEPNEQIPLSLPLNADLSITMTLGSKPRRSTKKYRAVKRPDGIIVEHPRYRPAGTSQKPTRNPERNLVSLDHVGAQEKHTQGAGPNSMEHDLMGISMGMDISVRAVPVDAMGSDNYTRLGRGRGGYNEVVRELTPVHIMANGKMAVLDVLQQFSNINPLFFAIVGLALTACAIGALSYSHRVPKNAPPQVKDDLPVVGALGFWTRRWEWWSERRDQSKTGTFSFHAGPNMIVALSGDRGRQLFFESKDLGFTEGYAVLFGNSPKASRTITAEDNNLSFSAMFHRRLNFFLKNDQFRRKLPILISDTKQALEAIKNEPSGRTNPFESLYRIVFRLTIRMVGATEIADDPQMLEEVLKMFETIESSSTATSVLFPKLPSPALLKRNWAGAQLYMMIDKIIKKRAASDEKHDDALQYLLDQGDRAERVAQFVVGALFAGLLNSGINVAWVMSYLATSPEWLAKANDEVRSNAARYAKNPNAPLLQQLDDVPTEAWEAEFPVIDMCLRDSLRLNLLGTAFRRNISGKNIPTGNGDEVIPPGAFVTYAPGDIHYDPEIYPDPQKWDPARYMPDRAEDKKKAAHGFLGWGSGRHPCLGMRFAKLEQNIITAYFIATFDFKLEDESGNVLTVAPLVDPNWHSAHKPKELQFLRVTTKQV
ncbi:hypothetical protein J4E85_003901 [Alternaria conjuncta]|uniref:uncharacterized protein n=1 Tax=Alternaria conjuncta TaxID=181017 RepID=UPI00221E4D9C|nr:uncharacterized protein J4E85_003901 [Alternaria conjuncta]KAI4931311.1 hypothetical protein J4E85_003901 [Alternaria conjuncta]